jgi:diphthine synthase
MLTLVGLGLHDEKDLTLRGIDAAKHADKIYIELYTSVWHGKAELEKIIGKKIEELKREDMEQHAEKIVDEAKIKDIVIFVPGDPMIATTHSILIEEARKRSVKVRTTHNASIISAIGETGLHIYKFGASATVPFPEKTGGKLPESVYNVIKLNMQSGLHTLLLLDITPERCMIADEAMRLLLAVEEQRKENVFTNDTEVVIFARAGSEDSAITFGKVSELKSRDFGKPPMVLIVPGILHFSEKEFLERLLIGTTAPKYLNTTK